jgi:hypothetical protein
MYFFIETYGIVKIMIYAILDFAILSYAPTCGSGEHTN